MLNVYFLVSAQRLLFAGLEGWGCIYGARNQSQVSCMQSKCTTNCTFSPVSKFGFLILTILCLTCNSLAHLCSQMKVLIFICLFAWFSGHTQWCTVDISDTCSDIAPGMKGTMQNAWTQTKFIQGKDLLLCYLSSPIFCNIIILTPKIISSSKSKISINIDFSIILLFLLNIINII